MWDCAGGEAQKKKRRPAERTAASLSKQDLENRCYAEKASRDIDPDDHDPKSRPHGRSSGSRRAADP